MFARLQVVLCHCFTPPDDGGVGGVGGTIAHAPPVSATTTVLVAIPIAPPLMY